MYVGNNPLIYVDPTGHFAEAAQQRAYELADLLRKATTGRVIHQAVQAEVKRVYGLQAQTEVANAGGRADIVVDKGSHFAVYEIKPMSNLINTTYNRRANKQLSKYVDALNQDPRYAGAPVTAWPAPLEIRNQIPYPGDPNKVIVLTTTAKDPGLIYYEVQNVKQPQEQPQEQPQPQPSVPPIIVVPKPQLPKLSPRAVPGGGGAMIIPGLGGGGFMPAQIK